MPLCSSLCKRESKSGKQVFKLSGDSSSEYQRLWYTELHFTVLKHLLKNLPEETKLRICNPLPTPTHPLFGKIKVLQTLIPLSFVLDICLPRHFYWIINSDSSLIWLPSWWGEKCLAVWFSMSKLCQSVVSVPDSFLWRIPVSGPQSRRGEENLLRKIQPPERQKSESL